MEDNYTVTKRRRRSDDAKGEHVEVKFTKMMSSNMEMSGGSVSELQQLLAATTAVQFMKVENRESSTELELVGYKDVNYKPGDDLPTGDELSPIKMPFASKLFDLGAESEDIQEQKLARILHKSEIFRKAQHNKNERQAKKTVKMEKSSQDIMILAVPALAPPPRRSPRSVKTENVTNQNETSEVTGLIISIKGWVSILKYNLAPTLSCQIEHQHEKYF